MNFPLNLKKNTISLISNLAIIFHYNELNICVDKIVKCADEITQFLHYKVHPTVNV